MAGDEISTLIHGLQEKTVKLKGKIMTSSGLERVHMCWKNVCLFVSRQFWRADLTQVSSSAWPRGRLTPEWGRVRKCLLAFNVIKLVKLWSSSIWKYLKTWILCLMGVVGHLGFDSTFNLITCWPRVHLYVLPVRVEHFMEFERKIYYEIPGITNTLFLRL